MIFPPAADAAAGQRLVAAFPPPLDAGLRELLTSLGGNSPYLTELALREPDCLRMIVAQGPDALCDLALSELAAIAPTRPRAEIAGLLRTAKRRVALAAAVADIGGAWSLAQVTGALSDLAEGALRLSVSHLLRAAHERGELVLPHPASAARGSGFCVLAMGKLGARELNFSSDVDLILVFDPDSHAYSAERAGAIFVRPERDVISVRPARDVIFVRVARDLVALMHQRNAGGYVFRTDLRLRPDPASTPLAVSLPTALAYYEGAAHTWERAAMIKARPVAGDLALGRRFLDSIRPFVWRRHLDFAAIADIRAMKRRMDGTRGAKGDPASGIGLAGHDLKLGRGGIREIEFCAQTLQLVWGGRNPALRAPATLAALAALQAAGHLGAAATSELTEAYQLLRQAEHRLQMVDDRQTHSLPDSEAGLARFACFMGASETAFSARLAAHLERVHAIFASLLEHPDAAPDLPAAAPAPALLAEALPGGAHPPWEDWLAGRPRALRTERARALLAELLPALIAVVERQPDTHAVWLRLDEFIHRLPAGVQLFSMLRHNPALLDRIVDVLGAAPSLADHLASVPAALEGLMAPQDIDPAPAASLGAQLEDQRGVDEALAIASRFVRGEEFRLAVAELDGRIDQDQAGAARTALAEATIGRILPLVLHDHARRFGTLRDGALVVVALGKAGSREMMAGSDLDLMLIYDHPEEARGGAGATALAPSQYFARAAQAIIAALTVPTRDGKLYDVDMRLRPSGGKGPVAVSLAAFERYHRESAWTWERLALTRARTIAGPKHLQTRVARAIRSAMAQGGADSVLADTLAMRRRLLAEHPPAGVWDAKQCRGGLIEVEFIAQALQVKALQLRTAEARAGRDAPLAPETRLAFGKLVRAGLLPAAEAQRLIQADAMWRAIQGLLRITLGRSIPTALPDAAAFRIGRALDRLLGAAPESTLQARIEPVAADVARAFARHVGDL